MPVFYHMTAKQQTGIVCVRPERSGPMRPEQAVLGQIGLPPHILLMKNDVTMIMRYLISNISIPPVECGVVSE